MKIIHFGAGNIGRGFIGRVLAAAGVSVVFADINQKLVDEINLRRCYKVRVVGTEEVVEEVNNVRAVHTLSEELPQLVAEFDLITTAVGPQALGKIAPTLVAGLTRRYSSGATGFLNIIACENMLQGSSRLKYFIWPQLSDSCSAWVEEHVGFVDAVVDCIVPPAPVEIADPLAVCVESFSEWIVDRTQFKGVIPNIPGMQSSTNLMAYVERKLFTLNTGHAVAAYLGQLAGHNEIGGALSDPRIERDVRGAMEESGAVLVRRYQFDQKQHLEYIYRILQRFKNPFLHDEVLRVGRQPLRKLGSNERLIKPYLGALEYHLPYKNLLKGVAGALLYRNQYDPEAIELQNIIKQFGVIRALKEVAGVEITEATGAQCLLNHYKQLNALGSHYQ